MLVKPSYPHTYHNERMRSPTLHPSKRNMPGDAATELLREVHELWDVVLVGVGSAYYKVNKKRR
jgi:hypothetical protein